MKLCKYLALGTLLVSFIACNFTEEIYFQQDESGKISISMDGSELLQMAGDQMQGATEKSIDSIISFKKFLEEKKDSIALLSIDEQEKLKKLEPFSLRLVVDEQQGKLQFDLFSDFKKITEVTDLFNAFQNIDALNPAKGSGMSAMSLDANPQYTEVDYSFALNTFTRKTRILDKTLHAQSLDSLQGMEMFLAGSSYKLKYHFPKRIKKTSLDTATFSADGKTLFYEIQFMDYLKNPEGLDIVIELEN